MQSPMIDLHVHTTASDGTMNPAELVKYAASRGLSAVGITDHDTMDGLAEAQHTASQAGIDVVPGVEISCEYKGPVSDGRAGWMHMLVFYPPAGGAVEQRLNQLKRFREERNTRLVGKLRELGVEITMEQVLQYTGGGLLGRPHFARFLVDKGYARDIQDAFDRYLGKGAGAYVDKQRLTPEQALLLATQDGAVPVLAHPYSLHLSDIDSIEKVLARLKEQGLQGIEAWYPHHDPAFTESLLLIANGLGLVATGGSDFHGSNKDGIELGSGIGGNLSVPDSVLDELEARRGR
ncbi:MAG: PHP domain-containing protein [Deltaproteobacteria bacterium]|nr:MAG: PHP domain-containing protein [Deltaproteobacteria bacterium]